MNVQSLVLTPLVLLLELLRAAWGIWMSARVFP
jgi:hypothetical protein